MKFPQGEGSAVFHRKKNDLLHKDATYMYVCATYSLWKGEFIRNQKPVVKRLKIPKGLYTLLFHPVIHRKKNDLIHKDATYISVSQPLAGSIQLNNWNRIIVFQKNLRPVKATCNDRKWVNKLNIPQGFSTILFCQLTDFL